MMLIYLEHQSWPIKYAETPRRAIIMLTNLVVGSFYYRATDRVSPVPASQWHRDWVSQLQIEQLNAVYGIGFGVAQE